MVVLNPPLIRTLTLTELALGRVGFGGMRMGRDRITLEVGREGRE